MSTRRVPSANSLSVSYQEYSNELKHILDSITGVQLEPIVALLRARRDRGAMVYIAGNGGSAANASHAATHLRECGIKAVCLSDSPSHLTAIGNDFGYEHVFTKGIPGAQLDPLELVVAFSCSGNSPNILNLLSLARKHGAATVGILGFGGGLAKQYCDASLNLDSKNYGALEDAHSAIVHVIKEVLIASP